MYQILIYHNPVLKVASKNVREQQVEMARFLHKNYKNETILTNDIGVTPYFSEVQLIDIKYIASTNAAKFIIENRNLDQAKFDDIFFGIYFKIF